MPPVFSRETTRVSVQDASHAGQGRTSPCECRCPAGNPIQKMERAIADGNEALALEYLRARNPFPGVTGRVCPHPCETGCNRNSYDEGVAIRALERHAADYGSAFRRMKSLPSTGKRIAVIGSGPAGLTCAYFSALLGHTVDVFEASPVAGGVPRQAIPDFRLPKAVVDREVGLVLGLGVNILTNTAVGRDISLASLLERYDACLIAAGNGKERRLNIPGIEHALPAVRFLRESNLNRTRLDGKRVAILGGGGVAFDCAFTVKRLGAAETHLVFLEDMGHVRVPAEEIRQAEDEGIRLHPSHLASAVHCGNGTVSGVTADAVSGFRFDERGNLSVDRIPGSVLELEADIVICASGLTAALDFLDAGRGAHPARFHRRRSGNGHDLEAGPVRRRGMRLRAFPSLRRHRGRAPGSPCHARIPDRNGRRAPGSLVRRRRAACPAPLGGRNRTACGGLRGNRQHRLP